MNNNSVSFVRQNAVQTLQLSILFRCLHDIQSPLSAVSGYLELLQLCTNTDQSIEKIDRYGKQLAIGVNELSHIIRLIRNSHDMSPEDITANTQQELNVHNMLKDMYHHLQDYASYKEITIRYKANDTEFTLLTDRLCLRLILYNLIMLAIKFTGKENSILIETRKDKSHQIISIHSQHVEKPAPEILNHFNQEKSLTSPAQITERCLRGNEIFGIEYVRNLNGSLTIESSKTGGLSFNMLF